ncbi:MAG: hypothetical protein U0002_12900 [Thermoanaerobaculia bacterium]
MASESSLSYTRTEIESYLPSGWALSAEKPEGEWDSKAGSWTTQVRDGVDFEWPVSVKASEAATKGRLGALQEAMSRVYRGRLGKPTRGLGIG